MPEKTCFSITKEKATALVQDVRNGEKVAVLAALRFANTLPKKEGIILKAIISANVQDRREQHKKGRKISKTQARDYFSLLIDTLVESEKQENSTKLSGKNLEMMNLLSDLHPLKNFEAEVSKHVAFRLGNKEEAEQQAFIADQLLLMFDLPWEVIKKHQKRQNSQ